MPPWSTSSRPRRSSRSGRRSTRICPTMTTTPSTPRVAGKDGSRCTPLPKRGQPTTGRGGRTTPGKQTVSAPDVVEELDYEQLTLAQLRARLQSLDVDELEALLAYEEATKGRAPFQTLLANRITRATAK